ncbi:MAG: S1 RNA-binding domain-containing protein [Anaerolineales bacterium]
MTKLTDLKTDDAVQGKVSSIKVAGAFVDVGAESDGFVHLSRLLPRSNRVEDVLTVEQELELWVHKVDPDANRLELTMIRPTRLKWDQIKPGLKAIGSVTRLENYGAFVDIGAEREGLVHVSEMSDGYVRNPAEVAKVGDEVEVAVLEVDRGKKQIRLTMNISLEALMEDVNEEEEEEMPTAMEVALRQAMETPSSESPSSDPSQSIDEHRGAQDDILARTLTERVKTSTDSQTNED